MTKTTVADIPDEAYEQILTELATTRVHNNFLTQSLDLLRAREEEALYVKNSDTFITGYKMALHDIGTRMFNTDIELGQDMDEPDREAPTEAPF